MTESFPPDVIPPVAKSEAQDSFAARVRSSVGAELHASAIDTIQANVGLRCNLACRHCHVESSPARREEMDWSTMELVLDAARRAAARTLDITGGAPEMHPHFRRFVASARAQGLEVIVRTNLTILLHEDHETTAEFLAAQRCHLIASLPCYLEVNVDRQRGHHVFEDSIEVVRRLNAIGYGIDPKLTLDLIYNPGGPSLPPSQRELEDAYRHELLSRYGLSFNRLFTLTNMPIGRFMRDLERDGHAISYTQLLKDRFNPSTVDGVMCRRQIHVGWDGSLSDCDFNFALRLPVDGTRRHIRDFDVSEHGVRRIRTGAHCFGCTAGAGSSCKGSLVSHDS